MPPTLIQPVPDPSEAPYLNRALRAVLVPTEHALEVRAFLLCGGVPILPGTTGIARTHVIALADGADLDRAADLLRDYAGWPH